MASPAPAEIGPPGLESLDEEGPRVADSFGAPAGPSPTGPPTHSDLLAASMNEFFRSLLAPELSGLPGAELEGHRFAFGAPVGVAAGFLILLALAIAVGVRHSARLPRLPSGSRALAACLRAFAFALIAFMLLDPCIVARRIRPGDQYVVMLFDDSRSMRVEAEDGRSRGLRVQTAWDAARADLEERIGRKFRIASHRFGADPFPLRDPAELKFDERESDLVGAIDGALRDLEGVDVAGVVVFGDGIQQSDARPAIPSDYTPAAPVFAFGTDLKLDPETGLAVDSGDWRDLSVERLSHTRALFDGSPVVVTAGVRAFGLAGAEAVAEILVGDRALESRRIAIKSDDHAEEVRLEFVPSRPDWVECRFRVRLAETGPISGTQVVADISAGGRDRVLENNTRAFLVDDRPTEWRILHLAGRPDWENKFLRRALEEDRRLALTSLLRISRAEKKFVFRGRRSGDASNPLFQGFDGDPEDQPRWNESVFLRMGVKESELESGFPTLPEELFQFHALLIGDLEYEFFAREQLELVRDFVRKRGGALLMMGGPHSFSEGGYDGGVLEEMMPVVLGPPDGAPGASHDLATTFQARPTAEGLLAGSWMLDSEPERGLELWNSMPPLHGLNRFELVRPGGTVMAMGERSDGGVGPGGGPGASGGEGAGDASPLFVLQRYGEGRSAVLATGSTWPWRMRLPSSDSRHERFWRQTLRGLVQDVPGPVALRERPETLRIGDAATLGFLVRDARFDPREELRATIAATAPSGKSESLAVEESIREPGVYRAEIGPDEPGVYRFALEAADAEGKVVARHEEALLALPDDREFQKARFDGAALGELARRTGGRLLALEQLGELPDLIPRKITERSEEVRVRLWKFPGFFFALATALAGDWYLRRRNGYA